MKRLLLVLALLFVSLAHAADAPPAQPATQPAAQTAAAPKVDYKDQFLALALDKAKLYSGKVEDAIGKGVDVAMKEAPETLAQWVKWRLWLHGIKALGIPLLLVGFILLQRWQWPQFEFNVHENLIRGDETNVILSIVGWVGIVASTVGTIIVSVPNLLSFIQLAVAPRVYLIDQVIELAKGR